MEPSGDIDSERCPNENWDGISSFHFTSFGRPEWANRPRTAELPSSTRSAGGGLAAGAPAAAHGDVERPVALISMLGTV
jgi:hypothetical protein